MIKLFAPWNQRKTRKPTTRSSLRFEVLEDRANPSAPVLTADPYTNPDDNLISISGNVDHADPVNWEVVLDGVASATTTPDANGDFTFTDVEASAVGQITLQAVDPLYGATPSNVVTQTITNQAPTFNYFAGEGGDTPHTEPVWSFEGIVTDDDPGGLTVTFTGAVGTLNAETLDVEADGSFFVTVILQDPPDDEGTVYAHFTDWFGQTTSIGLDVDRLTTGEGEENILP